MEITLSAFTSKVHHSEMDASLKGLEELWSKETGYEAILDAIVPAALSSFSHRYSSMHVPKENEYLRRFLNDFPRDQQLDFLKRYIEYLVWSPKYMVDSSQSIATGSVYHEPLRESYLDSLAKNHGIPALHYIQKMAEDSLKEATRTILQVGCIDVSQAIGHYFSCTESMIKLGHNSGMPLAGDNLFTATLYLMQSGPVKLESPQEPSMDLDEILSNLIRKTGFVSYHYMILANGLINQRDFIGEEYYQHGLSGLEKMLPELSDGMSHKYFENLIDKSHVTNYDISDLKENIWKGNKSGTFKVLKEYHKENGLTPELERAILHSYTKIDDHPHDPHYVTVPRSLFELIKSLRDEDVVLALAHSVEFSVNRIQRSGVMSSL
ncbi:hypothetical protein GF319_01720 [Candidatus Bathyarchaeota archaeon]|nr:hypothetical protein [Candidatus Bathyarchaeota archaeon]